MIDGEFHFEAAPTHIKVLKQIDLTNPSSAERSNEQLIPTPARTSVLYEELIWQDGALDNLITATEKDYIRPELAPDFEEGLDIYLQPITDLPPTLGHITTPENFARNIESPIWGSAETAEPTYIQTSDFSVEGYINNDYMISLGGVPEQQYRLFIDTQRLRAQRGIYLDMESIDVTPHDFGKSFIVLGGIPRDAIIRAELIEISPRPLSEVSKGEELVDEEILLAEGVVNEARLKDFINTLPRS